MRIKDLKKPLTEMAKKQDVEAAYLQHVVQGGMSRQDFLKLLQQPPFNMTPAGAGTYYQNAKSAHGKGAVAGSATPAAPVSVVAKTAVAKTAVPAAASPTSGEGWLKQHKVANASLNKAGAYDVNGDVHFDAGAVKEEKFPVQFGHVTGNFICAGGELKTAEGCPTQVDGELFINHNHLTSLFGMPAVVGTHCSIAGNIELRSLEHCSQHIGGKMYMQMLPEITSLQDIHKNIKSVGGILDVTDTPLKSHVLGLLLIKKLPAVRMDNKKVEEIINKHLAGERDIHTCQEELIEAGFADFARL